MTNAQERWARVEELFFAALELDPSERDDHLRLRCGSDEALADEVRELLAAHTDDGGFDRMAGRFGREVAASVADRATRSLIDRLNEALEGRYHVEREIGRGGMATVYLADDLRHERQVALKLLRPELAAAVGPERFLAEIRTTARLQHPQILPLFDSGTTNDSVFYVMPYVEGETLRERLDREQRLPVAEVVRVGVTVAEALGVEI